LEAISHRSNLNCAYLTPYALSLSRGRENALRDQADMTTVFGDVCFRRNSGH
jgi:hypothetical protein